MNVLFVGEGDHDIGGEFRSDGDRVPGGVVPALCKRVCPAIDVQGGSIARRWHSIRVLQPNRGSIPIHFSKAKAAVILSRQKGLAGTILVHDRDGRSDRLAQIQSGLNAGAQMADDGHRIAGGVAVESIEAWTLGAQSALCRVLKTTSTDLERICKPGMIEKLYANSGNPQLRSKTVLENVCKLGNSVPTAEFRQLVAENTDIAELERNCPDGFRKFATELRSAFS